MTCPECGTDSDGSTPACTWCGAPLTDEPSAAADPAAEPVQVICPECGADTGGLAPGALGWAWPGAAGHAEATHVCARCEPPVAYQPSVAVDQAVSQEVSTGWSASDVVIVGVGILVVIVLMVVIPLLTGWVP
jgi:hypothetical protein